MICAVCNCVCQRASIYRLGDLVGDVCPECQEGLAHAVRGWVVRRTRELAQERRQVERSQRRAQRETYPRGLRLVGGRL
jgi:hypothetical protein